MLGTYLYVWIYQYIKIWTSGKRASAATHGRYTIIGLHLTTTSRKYYTSMDSLHSTTEGNLLARMASQTTLTQETLRDARAPRRNNWAAGSPCAFIHLPRNIHKVLAYEKGGAKMTTYPFGKHLPIGLR